MSKLIEKLTPLLAAMEEEAKEAKNVAELEQILLKHQDELMGTSFEDLAKELPSEDSPP